MKWPRFQFSLRTLFLVTALIAIGLVAARWWISPHRLVIPSATDNNSYQYMHGVPPSGNMELEYYNGLGNRKYVSVAYDVTDIVRISLEDDQNQSLMTLNHFTDTKLNTPNMIYPERIIRVVAEINEAENHTRNRQNLLPCPLSNQQAIFLSNQSKLYIRSKLHICSSDLRLFQTISLDDVPPSIRSRVTDELDAIRRKQSDAN